MKRLAITIILFLQFTLTFSNPIELPAIYLDYLHFDSANNWEIRLEMYTREIDSIVFTSSTRKKTIRDIEEDDDYLILNEEIIGRPNFINPEGDSIYIRAYTDERYGSERNFTECLVFGNYRNASVPKPETGQWIRSIYFTSEYSYLYTIVDSNNAYEGSISGTVYDKNNNPASGGSIAITDIPFYAHDCDGAYFTDGTDINSDGSYSFSMYSMNYNIDTIYSCSKHTITCDPPFYYNKDKKVGITPVNFTVYPDSNQTIDIYLLEDIVSNKEREFDNRNNIFQLTNPCSGELSYFITLPVLSMETSLSIFSMEGKLVYQHPINSKQGELSLPSELANGTYLVYLTINNITNVSSKLILAR